MSDAPLIAFEWDGESMVPLTRFRKTCDHHFVVGQRYNLEERLERSSASHRFYFAAIREAWQSLPERLSEQFPTPERLRKYALIKAGYADSQTFVAASAAQAQRLAAFLRPVDEFSIVTVDGASVTRWTAKSQSQRAMPKGEFQRSKDAVLEVIAGMLDVTAGEIADHARAA